MIEFGDIYSLPRCPEPFIDSCVVVRELNKDTGNIDTAFLIPGTAHYRHHAQLGNYYANCFRLLSIPEKYLLEQCKSKGKINPEEREGLKCAMDFVENLEI